ncbi:DNA mismatch repair endonuclease MutL [Eubacteriales bacterium OttesenSCG-928-A19]|nr:DNA mismatch repair endonuclease MutL [Eubacteriales bacterium OttesenSCG-928-A19]
MRHVIRQLDPQVVGQIAAGEVVERPAFAIKELIENSIDAGATAVTVEIRDGGLTYFRVVDNGCGIVPEDIRMAFARHATSKLRTAEELAAIHTLGFRGEALASIAAVARLEMTTRAVGGEAGVKAVVHGGVIESIQAAASPEGTSITVRDLFYNTPARQKFLKKPATEAGLVSDLVMRLILARPDIAFRLMSAERQIYHSTGNGDLRDALFSVLGTAAIKSLVEVKGSAMGCAVHGYVGVGEAARSGRQMQTFILNGRYVKNTFLSQALEEGCRERVMIGKHPVCALHLTMPFESVDVNVHPNKLEVRFQDERALMAGLSGVIRASFEVEPLAAAPLLTLEKPLVAVCEEASSAADERPETKPESVGDRLSIDALASLGLSFERPAVRLRDSGVAPPPRPAGGPMPAADDGKPPPQAFVPPSPPEQVAMPFASRKKPPLRVIGVAWFEYVFAELDDMLYIIDQHAAHERILYEKYTRALEQDTLSQQLLVPQVIQLTHREHTALMESLEDLRAAGFDVEDFGDRSIQVRAVPMVLGVPQMKDFFGELADRLGEYRALPTQEKRRDVLVKLACRKAVKAGDPLPLESVEAFIEEMRSTGAPPTCPHGRPLVVAINRAELDKRFRRIP